MKLPDLFWYALEVLRLVGVDIARLAFLVDCKLGKSLLNEAISGHRKAGDELSDLCRLPKVLVFAVARA